jgi:hypothetical protein
LLDRPLFVLCNVRSSARTEETIAFQKQAQAGVSVETPGGKVNAYHKGIITKQAAESEPSPRSGRSLKDTGNSFSKKLWN